MYHESMKEKLDTQMIVNIIGGGGGIRTHVLHGSRLSFYECSLFLIFIV